MIAERNLIVQLWNRGHAHNMRGLVQDKRLSIHRIRVKFNKKSPFSRHVRMESLYWQIVPKKNSIKNPRTRDLRFQDDKCINQVPLLGNHCSNVIAIKNNE